MMQALNGKRLLASVCALVLFCVSVTTSYAQNLGSLGSIGGPIAGAAISCNQDRINSGLKSIFGGGNSDQGTDTSASQSVPIYYQALLKKTNENVSKNDATQKKLNCTNAIQKAASQAIINELTKKTVNWINNGFKSDKGNQPLFIKDTGSFLNQIKNDSINQFTSTIGCTGANTASDCAAKFPFGTRVAQEIANQSKTYFESAAQYDLGDRIGNRYANSSLTPQSLGFDTWDNAFKNNFSIGGWTGFGAQFETQNNPYGFEFAANQVINARVADTSYSPANEIKDELTRNQGFLDIKKCAPGADYIEGPTGQKKCSQYTTVTPGSIVANQLQTALGSTFRQLENGQDLSTAITAIFNALSNQLLQKGLSYLDSGSSNSNSTDYSGNTTLADNSSVYVQGDNSWSSAGQQYEYNIFDTDPSGREGGSSTGRNNLYGLVIREQEIATLLQQENDAASKLIPAIYDLDYCIPGPNPLWESDFQTQVSDFINDLPQNWDDQGLFAERNLHRKYFDPGGAFSGIEQSLQSNTLDKKTKAMFAEILKGIGIPAGDGGDSTASKDIVSIEISTIASRYQTAMEAKYALTTQNYGDLLVTAVAAKNDFMLLPKYSTGLTENQTLLADTETRIAQIQKLIARVNNLSTKNGHPNPMPTTYEGWQQILADIQTTKTSNLSDFQAEVKYINSAFSILAPDVPTEEDVTKEEATLDDINTRYDDITAPRIGLIADCKQKLNSSTYTGPTERIKYYPQTISSSVANLPITKTFLPGYFFSYSDIPNAIRIGDLFGHTVNDTPSAGWNEDISKFEDFLRIY